MAFMDGMEDEKTAKIVITQPTTGGVDPATGKPIDSAPVEMFNGLGWFWQESPSVIFQSDGYKPAGSFTAIIDFRDLSNTITQDMTCTIQGRGYTINDAVDYALQGEFMLLGLDYVN
jgi:hypothetical protein